VEKRKKTWKKPRRRGVGNSKGKNSWPRYPSLLPNPNGGGKKIFCGRGTLSTQKGFCLGKGRHGLEVPNAKEEGGTSVDAGKVKEDVQDP